MEINYKGIDYGLGLSNIDNDTGIRYGVISQSKVGEAWFDSSEAQYSDVFYCPECGNELTEIATEERDGNEYCCEHCNAEYTDDDINDFEIDPIGFVYNADGYICEQYADDTDIFIIKSPYFTYCQFCSPCAPGAGYLMNTVENGVKAYCLGHDWFEDNKAPYPVYSVETGELIEA
jgi:uncharacterized Zn ribbon protein